MNIPLVVVVSAILLLALLLAIGIFLIKPKARLDSKFSLSSLTSNSPCLVNSELCTVKGETREGQPCFRPCRSSRWSIFDSPCQEQELKRSYLCVSNDASGISTCYHPVSGKVMPVGSSLSFSYPCSSGGSNPIPCFTEGNKSISYRLDCQDGTYPVPRLCVLEGSLSHSSNCGTNEDCQEPCFKIPASFLQVGAEPYFLSLLQTPANHDKVGYGINWRGDGRYRLYDVPLVLRNDISIKEALKLYILGPEILLNHNGYWGFLKEENGILVWTQAQTWTGGPGLKKGQEFSLSLDPTLTLKRNGAVPQVSKYNKGDLSGLVPLASIPAVSAVSSVSAATSF